MAFLLPMSLSVCGESHTKGDAGHGQPSVLHACENHRCSKLVPGLKCYFLAPISFHSCRLLL